ncbi:DUF4360 domain-containing protein [Actinomadura meridiana]|uniref:DUF4360 domain-containing protein n=1 Tax=Actinomadura meridiana TaxID=559626 RepID=A0ABP8C2X2_9ACTN
MRYGITISAAAAALAMTAVSVAPAAVASEQLVEEGPDGVSMEIASVNGSGCPIGSAAAALSPSNDSFTVTYSRYLAQAGGGSTPTDDRKNCQISFKVHVPSGYRYAVSSVDYRGYASLQSGANASQLASYYFQGDSRTREYSHPISGPYDDDWQHVDATDASQLVWSPCYEQRNLNINTELRVDQGSSDPSEVNFIGMDSTDGNLVTTYHYSWRRCS